MENVCPICLDILRLPITNKEHSFEYQAADCWQLHCGHQYCIGCLRNWVKSKLNDHVIPILCVDLNCNSEIRPNDVSAVLDPELVGLFGQLLLVKEVEAEGMYCPKKECSELFLKPSLVEGQYESSCLFCETRICLQCESLWHEGLSCHELQNQLAAGAKTDERYNLLMVLKHQQKWQQCPKCKSMIERMSGCNWIRCKW
jgi:E3 ubiquitin-protein ligase RNF144